MLCCFSPRSDNREHRTVLKSSSLSQDNLEFEVQHVVKNPAPFAPHHQVDTSPPRHEPQPVLRIVGRQGLNSAV